MDDTTDDFQTQQLTSGAPRRTYLVTYSQANRQKFPTRESFGQCVVNSFNSGSGKVQVTHWACCLEQHKNGGEHYHLCLKLSGPKRWKSVKESIHNMHGVVLNFSDRHDNYYTAYKYVCKDDSNTFHCADHPNLDSVGSPKTKKCIRAYRESRTEKSKITCAASTSKPPKVRRLSALDVSEFLVKHNVKTTTELFSIAKTQKNEGNKELANYIMSRATKNLNDLLDNTWKMENSTETLQRQKLDRIDLIRSAAKGECIEGCDGSWYQCAEEVLILNKIHPILYAQAIRDLLIKGRGKGRNVMITGKSNCAKTFLLSPLQKIFCTFSNPATDKYAWLGVESAEVIFLNDFRWSSEVIAWKDFLGLLEGQSTHFPTPKNHYASDLCIEISNTIPIFATSKESIKYIGKFNMHDDVETEMMDSRWKIFQFQHQFKSEDQKHPPCCPKCFAKLTLLGEII